MSEVTEDAFLGGAVTVFQPRKGFRAGTDSVLLAAALDADAEGEALDLGCGVGGALLPAAWRVPGVRFTGLERDLDLAAFARRGVEANGLTDRVTILEGDAGALPAGFENRFDLVFSNPPYFDAGAVTGPGPAKAGAYIESLPLAAWIAAMLFALRPKGRLMVIHRAAQLTELLAALHRRAGEIEILPVRPHPGADAKRVLLRARKGLRPGPTRLLPALVLHDGPGGEPTATIEAIARTGQGLNWQAGRRS